jgi:hypothetical protein
MTQLFIQFLKVQGELTNGTQKTKLARQAAGTPGCPRCQDTEVTSEIIAEASKDTLGQS